MATMIILSQLLFFTDWKVFSVKTSFFRTFHNNSKRCVQEAVDKLFQHTLECKIKHILSSKLPFKSHQTHILDDIASICLKVRLPLDASKKQLTNCCSTPGMYEITSHDRLITPKYPPSPPSYLSSPTKPIF